MSAMKDFLKMQLSRHPILWALAQRVHFRLISSRSRFTSSYAYWEERYRKGGNSGAGSYRKFAIFKAEVVNEFIERNGITSVIEHGCGDGNQLGLLKIQNYIGLDVSEEAVRRCRKLYSKDGTKLFLVRDELNGERAQVALSMDVIYHLIEDQVFEEYMHGLFGSAERFVIIYSSNTEAQQKYQPKHIRHREFTSWVTQNCPEWSLMTVISNPYPYTGDDMEGSLADFYVYGRNPDGVSGSSLGTESRGSYCRE